MSELMKCPFCGGEAKGTSFISNVFTGRHYYSVYCKDCGANTAEFTEGELAIEAWNRRVESRMMGTGIIRRFDDLGRIVIPKEVRRKAFGTSYTDGKPMEIFYEKDGTIILKPYIAMEDDE